MPCSWGSTITTRVDLLTPICLCHFYAFTMTIKRWSKGSTPIVKRFLGKNFPSPAKNGPQNGDEIRGNGGLNIRFYVHDPGKARPCAEMRFGIFSVKIGPGALAVASCKYRKKTRKTSRVNTLVRKVTHARKRNHWADRDELLHRCRSLRLNHFCKLL